MVSCNRSGCLRGPCGGAVVHGEFSLILKVVLRALESVPLDLEAVQVVLEGVPVVHEKV